MRIVRRARPRPAIDMTPMIDCVFQLLIFFMLSSTFQAPMIQLTLPHATVADDEPPPDIMVSVDLQGRFFLNKEAVAPEELEARLRPLVAQSKQKVVTFRGDQQAPYQHFVRALEAARASGAAHLDVAHQGKP